MRFEPHRRLARRRHGPPFSLLVLQRRYFAVGHAQRAKRHSYVRVVVVQWGHLPMEHGFPAVCQRHVQRGEVFGGHLGVGVRATWARELGWRFFQRTLSQRYAATENLWNAHPRRAAPRIQGQLSRRVHPGHGHAPFSRRRGSGALSGQHGSEGPAPLAHRVPVDPLHVRRQARLVPRAIVQLQNERAVGIQLGLDMFDICAAAYQRFKATPVLDMGSPIDGHVFVAEEPRA